VTQQKRVIKTSNLAFSGFEWNNIKKVLIYRSAQKFVGIPKLDISPGWLSGSFIL